MNEKELIRTWNELRAVRVRAQLAPTLLLAVILALGATGHLSNSTDMALRIFTMGLVVAGGVFATTSMLSATRDAVWVSDSLKATKDLSLIGKKISEERPTTVLSGGLIALLTTFNLVVLWIYLFR
jgi:hypothetical protein